MIDFVNLKKLYSKMDFTGLENIIRNGQFVGGEALAEFERNFAEYCGVRHAVGVGSGTDALILSLLALGLGPGTEVIVPSNTFIATAFAVSHTGAKPVFADVNPITYNLDHNDFEEKITSKTVAVIPVHLYGNPCEMHKVLQIANRHGLVFV